MNHKYIGHITELHLIGDIAKVASDWLILVVPEILIYKYRHLDFLKVTLE